MSAVALLVCTAAWALVVLLAARYATSATSTAVARRSAVVLSLLALLTGVAVTTADVLLPPAQSEVQQ